MKGVGADAGAAKYPGVSPIEAGQKATMELADG